MGKPFPKQTPTVAEIWRRHKKNGIIGVPNGNGRSKRESKSDWTGKRFGALCRMMNATPHELGAMCGLTGSLVTKYCKRDTFPPPVAIHLLMFERTIIEKQCGRPLEPVIPVDIIEGRT